MNSSIIQAVRECEQGITHVREKVREMVSLLRTSADDYERLRQKLTTDPADLSLAQDACIFTCRCIQLAMLYDYEAIVDELIRSGFMSSGTADDSGEAGAA